MDETRPLNGLPPDAGTYRLLRESAASENDLEDHGGDGGALMPRRRKPRAEDRQPRAPDPAPEGDEDNTPALVQALDRLRTTHEGSHVDTDRIQALRGVRHYAEAPETRGFRRDPTTAYIKRQEAEAQRKPPAEATDAAAAADEEDEDPFAGL